MVEFGPPSWTQFESNCAKHPKFWYAGWTFDETGREFLEAIGFNQPRISQLKSKHPEFGPPSWPQFELSVSK